MRLKFFVITACLFLIFSALLNGCQSSSAPAPESGNGTETLSDSPPETTADTIPETQPETLPPATETPPETTPETLPETEVPETEEAADGIFDTLTRLSGFTESKNAEYLNGEQCDVLYNEDGSLTLKATVAAGMHARSQLSIDYARLMKLCSPAYVTTSSLPNGGEDKYRAMVIAVEAEPKVLAECDLHFSTGRRHTTQNTVLPIHTVSMDTPDGESQTTYLIFDMGSAVTEDYLNQLVFTWGCATTPEEVEIDMKLQSMEIFPTVADACAAIGTALPAHAPAGDFPLDIPADKLNPLIEDIFSGNTVRNETVMFLDAGDEKELLYDIDTILSVTSYDNRKTYKEGVDYAVRDGKLVALEGGSLPIITRDVYYGAGSDSLLITMYDGKRHYTHWGEGQAMTNWQVNVTYTHKDPWEDFDQPCEAQYYADFLTKLQNGEDVTIIFYGDSCTYGAASSFSYGYAPHQYSYAILVTEALADLFDYTVKYVSTGLSGTGPVPSRNYVAGERGTITYINPSVGGWGSSDALANTDTYLLPFIKRYGCDLFISDIGGNDGSMAAESTRKNVEGIIRDVREASDKDVCITIMSTLVNNPDAVNGWHGTEHLQEPALRKAAAALRSEGVNIGVCCITSMTLAALEHVTYNDISGNNINHPNDFWARMYACTLFENLLGYGNLT